MLGAASSRASSTAVACIVIAAVALLVYFRVPLGGCGASSALDEFAPRRKKHA
jgi:hypothetical protein